MELNRRTFLKIAGLTTAAWILPSGIAVAATPPGTSTRPKGMLSDLTKCIGCGWCQQACKDSNQLEGKINCPDADPTTLSAHTWTLAELKQVERNGQSLQVFVKRQCMHCLQPACVSACPVGALQKSEEGPVTYDPSRCIGCRYCMVACPFGVPKFDWAKALPVISKCTFCSARQQDGLAPACAAACPTGALIYGDREELITEAEARIRAHPDRYYPHIYGQDEVGGTSWMYISPVPFKDLGFPVLEPEPVTSLSEAVAVYGTPSMAVGIAALLGGVYYWSGRRTTTNQDTEYTTRLEEEKES
jgi:formate dehydrogenase iron-sulfur subunit